MYIKPIKLCLPTNCEFSEYKGINGHKFTLLLDAPVGRILFARKDGKLNVAFDQDTNPCDYCYPLKAVGVTFTRDGKCYIARSKLIIFCIEE